MGWRYGLVSALALVGCIEGAQGEKGDPGDKGDPGLNGDPGEPGGPEGSPSISGIFPATAYLEHGIDVNVTGFATTWKPGDTVALDFGPGITAGPVTVASSTSLSTRLTIDADAELGPREVKVGGLAYAGGFSVDAPLSVHTVQGFGPPKQGSVTLAEAYQHDLTTPFENNGDLVKMFLRRDATEIPVIPNQLSNYAVTYIQFIDVLVPPGPIDLVAESGVPPVSSTAPGGVVIEAQTPKLLTGPVTTGTVTTPRESFSYQVDSQADEWVHLGVSSSNPFASPTVFALPESGSFTDAARVGNFDLRQAMFPEVHVLARAGDTNYFIYWDLSPETAYDFDLALQRSPAAAPVVGATDNDHPDRYVVTAQAGETGIFSIGNGPTGVCGMTFAAGLTVYRANDGAVLFKDNGPCPGLPTPIQLTVPADGRYVVEVAPSPPAVCGGPCPPFDYSATVAVVP